MTEEFIGRIVNVNLEKNQIVLNDKDGVLQMFTYPDPLDLYARKQKQGWFVKLTLDGKVIKRIDYTPKPDWAQKQYPPKQPQNPRPMTVMNLVKAFTDLRIETMNPDDYNFEKACEDVVVQVEKYIDRVMKAGESK